MIVKNKKKFVRGILIVICITVGLVLLMTNKTFSHQDMKYKTISVVPGDTLWKIAEKEQKNNTYYKDKDIRDVVENIKGINNLKTSNLNVEQILEIPTY